MQARLGAIALCLLGSLAGAPIAAADPAEDGAGHRSRSDRPAIVIEPNIDLSRRRERDGEGPDAVMAEIHRCASRGVRLFIDCLRGRQRAVMIRRLEACVASETIPDDLGRVAACLPAGRLP